MADGAANVRLDGNDDNDFEEVERCCKDDGEREQRASSSEMKTMNVRINVAGEHVRVEPDGERDQPHELAGIRAG